MKNVVIADACSLIFLIKTGMILHLSKIAKLETTQQVLHECFQDMKRLDAQMIQKYVDERMILAININFKPTGNFGIGEESVFARYNRIKDAIITTDDGKAIRYCKLMKYRYTTTPLIIVSLWRKKKISKEEAIQAIHTFEAEGRYSKSIIAHFLITIGG